MEGLTVTPKEAHQVGGFARIYGDDLCTEQRIFWAVPPFHGRQYTASHGQRENISGGRLVAQLHLKTIIKICPPRVIMRR